MDITNVIHICGYFLNVGSSQEDFKYKDENTYFALVDPAIRHVEAQGALQQLLHPLRPS